MDHVFINTYRIDIIKVFGNEITYHWFVASEQTEDNVTNYIDLPNVTNTTCGSYTNRTFLLNHVTSQSR